MGPKPNIVAITFNLFLFGSLCSVVPNLEACGDSPGECKQRTDTISNLQTDTLLNRGENVGTNEHESKTYFINKAGGDDALMHGENIVDAFHAYIDKFGRTYMPGSSEYIERLGLFGQRKSAVEAQNSMTDRLWTAGINVHSDRNDTELMHLLGGDVPRKNYGVSGSAHISLRQDSTGSKALATEITMWNNLDAVKNIRNQGSCGSCWALSAVTLLQAHAEIAGRPRSFAAQELVDCVDNPHHCGGTGGCKGATVEMALDYVMQNGLATEKDVPYQAWHGFCTKQYRKQETDMDELFTPKLHAASHTDPSLSFGMVAWERLPENMYESLLHAVSDRGPVSVSVEGSRWFGYLTGIFDGCSSDPTINHSVLLVGYGEDAGTKFWLVQNAWGDDWGEEGKMRLLRNEDEGKRCGTDWKPKAGSGCDGGPSSIKVCGTCGILYNAVLPHFKA
mmetsp:Transcript_31987/g.61824  ORF Transcript_31987/g.61824 Transcript_31987/m.61824 type:complete len:449 (+) Transcript_31987:60-1406(+)